MQFTLTIIATDEGINFTVMSTPSFVNFVEECDDKGRGNDKDE